MQVTSLRSTLAHATLMALAALAGSLSAPAPAAATPLCTADATTLIRSGGSLSGNPAFLVVGYEYSPRLDKLDDLAYGGRTAAAVSSGPSRPTIRS